MSFVRQLRRPSVIKASVVYVLVAWLLLWGVDMLIAAGSAPSWLAGVAKVALFVGFPIAVMLAWADDLTRDAAADESDTNESTPSADQHET